MATAQVIGQIKLGEPGHVERLVGMARRSQRLAAVQRPAEEREKIQVMRCGRPAQAGVMYGRQR